MRQLQISERGSANWPFIISLILLLVFGYMWFDEKDQREEAQLKGAKAVAEFGAIEQAAKKIVNSYADLAQLVGWAEVPMASLITAPAGDTTPETAEAVRIGKNLAGPRSVTNVKKLKANLEMKGETEGEPGLLHWLIKYAEVEILKDIRSASGDAVSETPAKFDWMTPAFKAKLAEINLMEIPPKPRLPIDPDDEEDVARYENELAAYEEAVAAFEQALDELQQMEGWKKWDSVIKGARKFDPDTREVVKLDFFTLSLTKDITVEMLVEMPKGVINAMKSEFKKNKDADAAIIDQVRGDAATKAETIDTLQSDLAAEQTRRNTEVQQLSGELAVANETAESNRVEATQALQRVTVVEEEKRRDLATAESRISALENRIRIDKEVRNLKISRDEDDGQVLTASAARDTAIINLGTQDKVYPGLKFNVRYIGKGGHPLPKGQVMVTRVLGKKSAVVSIKAQIPGNPIQQGDILHNPLWSATDTVHIFLAGELEKYPLDIAKARLIKMGVILDPRVDGDTDYVVVPNSMAAEPVASDDEEDMGEEAVGGQTEYDRIQAVARTFGATVITEKMLNEFLDY